MRKIRFIALYLALILLCVGCSKNERPYTLMDAREPFGEGSNLWYIPNETVEGMSDTQLYGLGEDLLLQTYIYNEDLYPTATVLKKVSLADGSLLAEAEIAVGGGVMVQIMDNTVSVADPTGGKVTFLKEDLTESAVYELPVNDWPWRVSRDKKTVYCFDNDKGLFAIDLATKEQKEILPGGLMVSVCEDTPDYTVFSYVDKDTQMYRGASLNLRTGDIDRAPADGEIFYLSARQGDSWILSGTFLGYESDYLICNSDWKKQIPRDERYNFVKFAGEDRLLADTLGHESLTLYDEKGSFLSRCSLPEDPDRYCPLELVWSDHWQGYFFLQLSDEDSRLLFWDTEAESAGEALPLEAWPQAAPSGGSAVGKGLYERAEQLSQKFGVTIRIADQCDMNNGIANAQEELDPDHITAGLHLLERALGAYPEGFFKQINFGSVKGVQIDLVAELEQENNPDAAAYSIEDISCYRIVMDISRCDEGTFFHEVSHVIDARLAWDALCRPGALYSEDAWMALQPEGFDYAYSYEEIPEEAATFEDSGYFTEAYALTFPTEDRATLLAAAMTGSADFEKDSPLQKKLDFYRRCIRDCFDTENWPKKTAWE